MTGFATPTRELTFPEMLADPIVQTMMAHSGTTKRDLEDLIGVVRGRMAERRAEERRTGGRVPGPAAVDE